MFDIKKVTGISKYVAEKMKTDEHGGRKEEEVRVYRVVPDVGSGADSAPAPGKVFLVERLHTIEVRCDENLIRVLVEKYESVMKSRYFGRGGIEVVLGGQLTMEEIYDLVRLSYNMTKDA